MKKEKWLEVVEEELEKLNDGSDVETVSPETWPVVREKVQTFVKNIDQATEVYNTENPKKES